MDRCRKGKVRLIGAEPGSDTVYSGMSPTLGRLAQLSYEKNCIAADKADRSPDRGRSALIGGPEYLRNTPSFAN